MNQKPFLYIVLLIGLGTAFLQAGDLSLGKKAKISSCQSLYLIGDDGIPVSLISEDEATTSVSSHVQQSGMLSDLFDSGPITNSSFRDITVSIPKSAYSELIRLRTAWKLLGINEKLQPFLRSLQPPQLSTLTNHAYYCAIPLLIKAIKRTMLATCLTPQEYAVHHDKEAYSQRWKSLDPLAHQNLAYALLRLYRQHFIHESQYYVKPVAHDLKYTSDNRMLATTPGHNIELLDTVLYKKWCSLKGHRAWINSIDIASDGKKLLSGSTDTTAILWDIEAHLSLRRLREHAGPICTVCCSPDNKLMASSAEDGIVKIWDYAQARSIATISLPAGNNLLAFNPDSAQLAVSYKPLNTKYSNIALYDLHKGGEKEAEEITSMNGVASLAWDPLTKKVVYGDNHGTTYGCGPESCYGHGQVHSLAFNKEGTLFANADSRFIHLWKRVPSKTFKSKSKVEWLCTLDAVEGMHALQVRPDGKAIAALSNRGYLKVWDLKGYKKEKIQTIGQGLERVHSLLIKDPDYKKDFDLRKEAKARVASAWFLR